jgi:hypothetical protein
MGLRVTEDEERQGLDLSQHSESAYALTGDYDQMAPSAAGGHIPAGAKARSQNA